jgi:hypothetical protein
MIPNKQKPPTLTDRVAQFERDQRKNQAPSQPTLPPVSSDNPYLKARIEVLTKMNEWRRNEIKQMEDKGDTNNRFYSQYLVAVILAAGDVPSDALRIKAQ